LDADLKIRPQMVDKYTVSKDAMKYSFTLRDGLKFHDGTPVTAEDCVASIKRWGGRDQVGRLMTASLNKMVPVDRKTFTIDLETPFGLVLDALGKPSASPLFIMPARLAATDPSEQVVKEAVGSGPFKFVKDEWQPGNRVVYVKNPDYVPRNEKPSGAAGGKRALVDRVEWRYIPDLERAKRLLKESAYDGRPIVVMDPTDTPYAHAPALVTAEVLRSLGAAVDLQAMDWSTMVQRRAKKEPPAQGGWNIFHTWSTSFDTMTPAVSSVLGGGGEKAWFGWPTSEPIEKLRTQFVREPDAAKRKAIADEVQKIAYDE